jgi:hypothetical protein
MFGVSHVRFFKKAVAKRTLRFADSKLFSSVPNDPKDKFLAQLCSFLDRHCSHIRRRIAFTGTDENANQTRAIIGKPHKKVPKPLCLPLTFKCGWRAMTVGSPLPALTAVHTISFPCNRSRRNPSFTFHPMRRVPVMHEHISL